MGQHWMVTQPRKGRRLARAPRARADDVGLEKPGGEGRLSCRSTYAKRPEQADRRQSAGGRGRGGATADGPAGPPGAGVGLRPTVNVAASRSVHLTAAERPPPSSAGTSREHPRAAAGSTGRPRRTSGPHRRRSAPGSGCGPPLAQRPHTCLLQVEKKKRVREAWAEGPSWTAGAGGPGRSPVHNPRDQNMKPGTQARCSHELASLGKKTRPVVPVPGAGPAHWTSSERTRLSQRSKSSGSPTPTAGPGGPMGLLPPRTPVTHTPAALEL